MEPLHALCSQFQAIKRTKPISVKTYLLSINETETNLEPLSSVIVERSVVVHDVDELEIMSLSALVIVLVVCRSDLDGSSSEGHVDGDGVGDDWDPTSGNEGVRGELAVQMLRGQ